MVEACPGSVGCHVLIEEGEEKNHPKVFVEDYISEEPSGRLMSNLSTTANRQGKAVVTVNFYYTPQFAAVTFDVTGTLRNFIAQANEGYRNSQLDIEMQLRCIEEATGFVESNDPSAMLSYFRTMKGRE